MDKIAIVGNGGLTRSLTARLHPSSYDIYVSDDQINNQKWSSNLIFPMSEINKKIHRPLICIGWSQLRYKIYNELPKGIKLHTFIDER